MSHGHGGSYTIDEHGNRVLTSLLLPAEAAKPAGFFTPEPIEADASADDESTDVLTKGNGHDN